MKGVKTLGLASVLAVSASMAQAISTVHFWYHFDNADNPMSGLVTKFEKENPGIKIDAINVPWNSYYDQLYTAIIGGNAPDAAMVKMFAQPRLIEMGALAPIDNRLSKWPGKSQIDDNLFKLTQAANGKHYYLPIQYVALYLYYRTDMFKALGLTPPKTCKEFEADAKKLTRDTNGDGKINVYGFGFRGGKGGQDQWASFTLGRKGVSLTHGLTSKAGIAGTQFVERLFRKDHVFPPSAPNDGFKEIIADFKAGKTAMTIHHIGSANGMVAALGDKVSAVPVPSCGGGRWTAFGDESTAIFSTAKDKNAAWKWISFLSSPGNNAKFNEATGQLPVVKSDAAHWTMEPKRFVQATIDSLPFAHLYPNLPQTSDFVNTVWPTAMQRVLTGQITAKQMNEEIAKLYKGN